jgi:hypothetical protein
MVLVKTSSLNAAYAKLERIGKQNSKASSGSLDGVPVRCEYLGITELLPIYEKISDGVEIAWTQRAPKTLRMLNQMVKSRAYFVSIQ